MKCLVAIPPVWFDRFFPTEEARMRVMSLFADVRVCSAAELEPDRWLALLRDIAPEVIVTGWGSPALPQTVPGLRYICHICGSVRRVLPRRLLEDGVIVTNWGDLANDAVAEAALLLTLSALRRSHYVAREMHTPVCGWPPFPHGTRTLHGRTVGLHGFGRIARRLVEMLRPFRVPVISYSEGVPAAFYREHGVEPAESLAALFEAADVLIEIEALTEATRGSVNAEVLAKLREGAVFVSVGRGAVVDESALTTLAVSGKITVALDVYAQEPLPVDSPLRKLPDAVLFPHAGGPTADQYPQLGQYALGNLVRFIAGGNPVGVISLRDYDRST